MHIKDKLNAANKVKINPKELESESQTRSVSSINKLDRLVSKNKNKYKLNSLDLINHIDNKNSTPVTIANVYNLTDQTKIIKENLIVLLGSGALHSMVKASLVMKYKNSLFRRSEASYKTASGIVKSKYSMKLLVTLDEFGKGTKINHVFDLDENEDGIGYNMIIRRDLLNQLNIDIRFSDGTIKWEDQVVPMKNFQRIWKDDHPLKKEIRSTVLCSIAKEH